MGVDPSFPDGRVRRIPEKERWQASAEVLAVANTGLFDGYRDGKDRIASLPEITEGVQWLIREKQQLAKAIRMESYSLQMPKFQSRRIDRGHDSVLYVNEYGLIDRERQRRSRWVEKPAIGGFSFLREVVHNVDVLKAIILTATKQIISFCQPERNSNPLGYRLVRRDREKITAGEKKRVQALESWIQDCGDEHDYFARRRLQRHSMKTFVSKFMWDSLSYDSSPIELEWRGSKPSGIYHVPGDTIRLCTEQGYEGQDEIFAVQVIDGKPETAYRYQDLLYEVRNPRSDLVVNGYGYAEPEMFVRILTAWINSFAYNAAGLDRNAIPRGILAMFGDWDQPEINTLSTRLQAQLTGPANMWRMPIIGVKQPDVGGKGLEYIKVDDRPTEMYLAKWVTLLWSIGCAIYGMHPTEINMAAFDASNASPLSGSDTAEKLAHSRDKGLIPRLGYVADVYNILIKTIDDRYELEWAGLNEEDAERKFKREEKGSTMNEIRAANNQEPHELDEIGNAPADPAYLSLYIQATGIGQQGDDDEPQHDAYSAPDNAPETSVEAGDRRPTEKAKEIISGYLSEPKALQKARSKARRKAEFDRATNYETRTDGYRDASWWFERSPASRQFYVEQGLNPPSWLQDEDEYP